MYTSVKKENEKIIAEWFKDHQPVYKNYGEIEHLIWQRPGTSYYAIHYTCLTSLGTLFVMGDLGEAVYRWSGDVSLEWISKCDLSYFSGKCCASEMGRQYLDWSEEIAKKRIHEHFTDDQDCKGYKAYLDSYFPNTIHSKEEFTQCLSDSGAGDPYDIFGDDWYWVGGAGEVISIRCHAHLVGLRMAFPKEKA